MTLKLAVTFEYIQNNPCFKGTFWPNLVQQTETLVSTKTRFI